MSDNINIGALYGGNIMIGGTDGTITGPGVVNIGEDHLSRLRALLDELIRAIDAGAAPPAAREAAELARAEAAQAAPAPGKLRSLINAVLNGAQNTAAVTQAALNVLAVIAIIEGAVR